MNWRLPAFAGAAMLSLFHSSLAMAAQPAPARAAATSLGDRTLLQIATQLSAAASAHGDIKRFPSLEKLAAMPNAHSQVSNAAPSIDAWLQAALNQIRREKSAKTRAADLSSLSSAVRRMVVQQRAAPTPILDPQAEAARVLAQRAYQVGGSGPAPQQHQSLWEKFITWIAGLIERIFENIFKATSSAPIIGQIVAVLLIALLVAGVAVAAVALYRAFARRPRARREDEGSPLPQGPEPDELHRRGLAAAAAGMYAKAIALLFQASLAAFDKAGALALDPSLTPGEYRRAVRRRVSRASKDFDTIAQAFVLAAFAERPISPADWSAADDAYVKLRAVLVPA